MSMQDKQAARKNKQAKHATEPRHITHAVTHIRLADVNAGKLAALETLAPVYLTLCQQYVTLFCTEELPNKLRDPLYETPLSERWHRVAIMQAAGIAKSWRRNRANAWRDYEKSREKYNERLAEYRKQQAQGAKDPEEKAILDKEVVVGKNCQIGTGDDQTPNRLEPSRLNTGITLIGKRTRLPDGLSVGRNSKIGADLRPEDFTTTNLASGETIEDRSFAHGWEREMARRIASKS